MQTRENSQHSFLWALIALVLLKILIDGIRGWSDIARLLTDLA